MASIILSLATTSGMKRVVIIIDFSESMKQTAK